MKAIFCRILKKRNTLPNQIILCFIAPFILIFTFRLIHWLFQTATTPFKEPIDIGLVSCSRSDEEVATLIKSILISAKIYSVLRQIRFHVVVDANTEDVLEEDSRNFRDHFGSDVNFSVKFYRIDKIPKSESQEEILEDSDQPCAYIRTFFPDIFATMKKILYLDKETLVTGNIETIWETVNDYMYGNNSYVAAMAQNTPDSDIYYEIYQDNFEGLPHVKPRGVNTGVMFMDLDRLRRMKWSDRVIYVYRKGFWGYMSHEKIKVEWRKYMRMKESKYSLKRKNPQTMSTIPLRELQLINIVFATDKNAKLATLPCHYNIMFTSCHRGWSCIDAQNDFDGIQIVHGFGNRFQDKVSPFYPLYAMYQRLDLNLSTKEILWQMKQLKHNYTNVWKFHGLCGPKFGLNLFPSITVGVIEKYYIRIKTALRER